MIPWTTIEHEDMDAWEVFAFFVTRDNDLPVLRAISEHPETSGSKLIDRIENNISKSTLWDAIDRLGERGFIARNENDQYETTLLGQCALDIYDGFIKEIEEEFEEEIATDVVETFARSESAAPVLETLSSHPGGASDLERASVDASRITIYRRLSNLEEQGLISDGPPHEITPSGEKALEAYQRFTADMECVIDKAEFLQFFEFRSMAVKALHGTTVYEGSGSNPNAPTDAFADAVSTEYDYIHGVSPVVVSDYVEAFLPLAKNNAEIELVMDESTIESFRTDFPVSYALASFTESIKLLVSPEQISFGIALLADKEVWLGTYDSNGRHRATLQGSNEHLLEWAEEKFQTYRSEAYADPESITTVFKDRLAEEFPLITRQFGYRSGEKSSTSADQSNPRIKE